MSDPSPFPAGYGPVGSGDDAGGAAVPPDGATPPPFDQLAGHRPAREPYRPLEHTATGLPPFTPPGGMTRRVPAVVALPGPTLGGTYPPGTGVFGLAPRPGSASGLRRLVVRRVDVWTVFKVSLTFYLVLLAVVLAAGVVAWNLAGTLGLLRDITDAARSLGADRRFVLHPLAILADSAGLGALLVAVGTALNVLAAALYNLIADVVGGVQVVVGD